MTIRQPEGVLANTAPQQGGSAWIGLRVTPAPVLAGPGREPVPRAQALREEQSWLAAQWDAPGLRRFEIRYVNDPAQGLVTCTLLGVARGPDADQATVAAVALRESLGRLPAHLRAEPILDPAELGGRLAPFAIPGGATAEIRKRLGSSAFHSRDAPPRTVGVDVHPLRAEAISWNSLITMLSALPYPAMVSVCLQPWRLTEDQLSWYRYLAREYGRMAAAGERPGPANPYELRSGSDPFTSGAARTFANAAHRYADRAFRLRVSVTAAGPLPRQLTGFLVDALDGAEVRIGPADEEASARAIRTLDHMWRGESYSQGIAPGAIEAPERTLSDLVDVSEAAAAFRFPSQPTGSTGGFGRRPGPGPERHGGVAVVLTALELEYAAVRALLTELETQRHEDGLIVETGTLPGTGWTVTLAGIGTGSLGAAAVTQMVAGWLRPQALLFVGVARALKDDIALGDVVVATKIYSYAGGLEDDEGFHARPESWEAPFRLRQVANFALRSGDWARQPGGQPGTPLPQVHFEPIASGDILLASNRGELARRLRRHFEDAVAVDMQGSGVAQAAHITGDLQVLVVRGISNHANADKPADDRTDGRQRAAANAASAALAVIASLDPQEATRVR